MDGNKTENPYSWLNGPPKSESESWNFSRRCELLELATKLMPFAPDHLAENDRVDWAFDYATRLQEAADALGIRLRLRHAVAGSRRRPPSPSLITTTHNPEPENPDASSIHAHD